MAQAGLQRRGGRRVSIPSSPTMTDKDGYERLVRHDHSHSLDGASDRLFQSPTLDEQHYFRGPRDMAQSPAFDLSATHHEELTRLPFADSYVKASPVALHSSVEANATWRGVDTRDRPMERPGPARRNTSSTSLSTDRSNSDDGPAAKVVPPKKSRLNLLNPMSLLARRKASHHARQEELSLHINTLPVPAVPEFDPSIRGNFVHDFSAPRQRTPRHQTFAAAAAAVTQSQPQRPSDHAMPTPTSGLSPVHHDPVFKEHFDADTATVQPGQTGYLHRQPLNAPSAEALPAFAPQLPTSLPSPGSFSMPSSEHAARPGSPPPPPLPPKQSPPPPPPPPPAAKPSPPSHQRPRSISLPKHSKSTSSRFSFQIADGSVAQERELEQRFKERFPQQLNSVDDVDDEAENEYDKDIDPENFEADDFEEGIPGINADFDEEADEFGTANIAVRDIDMQTSCLRSAQHVEAPPQPPAQSHPMPLTLVTSHFHFTPYATVASPSGTNPNSEPTPRDANGFRVGVAESRYSPLGPAADGSGYSAEEFVAYSPDPSLLTRVDQLENQDPQLDQQNSHFDDDDDLYFDDGNFLADHISQDDTFDEDTLDDAGHIRDIPAENAQRYQKIMDQYGPGAMVTVLGHEPRSALQDKSRSSSEWHTSQGTASLSSVEGTEKRETSQGTYLTEGNLAAYHDALVTAANQAAANGRFDRQVTFDEASALAPEHQQQHEGVSPGPQVAHVPDDVGGSGVGDDGQYDFDDNTDPDYDLMIAEANAEVLEYDDDGFYGQEFGFYARAYGRESSELVNGGYFSARGFNGVKRSHSGKNNFQEPSLTPITERSEWSARNSIASLPMPPGFPTSAHSLPSPGLKQLLDSPVFDDEMSMNALMKLRRGTFGGSSSSLNSLGDRSIPGGSPRTNMTNHGVKQLDPTAMGRQKSQTPSATGSASIMESEEEEDCDRPSPPPTMAAHKISRLNMPGPVPAPPTQPATTVTLGSPFASRKSHSRNSSTAESVSYARDDDGRWILERRRTGDDGGVEVIEREYLAGVHI